MSIYIHWPFCLKKCPYCDFNSHLQTEIISDEKWFAAYEHELKRFHALMPDHKVNTIFFGGGTPSLMSPQLVGNIIDCINSLWSCSDNIEITLEANPSTFEQQKFEGFKAAGVNRLSIGVQSFRNDDLKFLGRIHDANEAINAIKSAQKIFDNVSFDLIYARPEQTLKQWEEELSYALSFNTQHLSLYQLTIEPETQFMQRFKRGDFVLPKEKLALDFFDLTHGLTSMHGYVRYEVSNHAKPGYESLHNKTYWQYGDYIGVGPGAHSRITVDSNKYGIVQIKKPESWLNAVNEKGSGNKSEEIIEAKDQEIERILMGLRLKCGIVYEQEIPESLKEFLVLENGHLRATEKGLQCLDAVIYQLIG